MDEDSAVKRAAGGVLWRPGPEPGSVEVGLVHRPRYDDWTFPKGKHKAGETDLEAAVREVMEETGHQVEVGPEVGQSSYQRRGRTKVVRYWAMRMSGGAFAASDEVDRLVWVSPAQAAQVLTYQRDLVVLNQFVSVLNGQPPA